MHAVCCLVSALPYPSVSWQTNDKNRHASRTDCQLMSLSARRHRGILVCFKPPRLRQRDWLSALMLSICLLVCLSVRLSPRCKKTLSSRKLSNLELWSLLTTYRKSYMAFQRTHYWTLKIQDGSAILKIDTTSFFSADGGPIWIKFRRLVQNDMSTVVIWSKSKPDVEFQYGGRLGELHDMLSQSHLPNRRV